MKATLSHILNPAQTLLPHNPVSKTVQSLPHSAPAPLHSPTLHLDTAALSQFRAFASVAPAHTLPLRLPAQAPPHLNTRSLQISFSGRFSSLLSQNCSG